MIQRTSFVFCLLATLGIAACGGAGSDGDPASSSSSDVVGNGGSSGNGTVGNPPPKPKPTCCDPATKPPPGIEGVWCCGDGTWSYDIGSGNQNASCGTHGGPGAVCEGGASCGPPPPVALCAQCPGDDINTMFKWIDGKPTCECCNAAAPTTCGPINGPITCAACKGGKNSYKYVNGKATCECCE